MLRKLLMIVCLLNTLYAYGQKEKITTEVQTGGSYDNTVKVDYRIPGASLPPDFLLLVNGKPITAKDIKKKHNTFILLFNPVCDHCMEQTKMLEKNVSLFKKKQLILVQSHATAYYLGDFDKITHVLDYPRIMVGIDSTGYVDKLNNYSGLPQMNIYDKDQKLIRILTPNFTIDSLKPYLQ